MARRALGPRGRLSAWLVLVLAVGLTTAALGNFDSFRYASLLSGSGRHCEYKLSKQLAKADTLILGSSRVLQAIDPDLLSQLISENAERVINFGLPVSSTARSYLILKDVLADPGHKLRRLIVEFNLGLNAPRNASYSDYNYHAEYYELVKSNNVSLNRTEYSAFASVPALFEDMRSKPNQSALLRVRDFFKQILVKVELGGTLLLQGDVYQTAFAPEFNVEFVGNFCRDPQLDKTTNWSRSQVRQLQEDFYSNHDDWFNQGFGWMPRLFDKPSMSREIFYIEHIVSLARKYDIEVMFTSVLDAYAWPPPPDFAVRFKKYFAVPFVVPDKNAQKKIIDSGYRDRAHLLPDGRDAYTRFLAGAILGRQ